MRKFINIVEHAGMFVPNPRDFVTDQLIDRIIETHMFVPHGDDGLYDWFEEIKDTHLCPSELKEMDLDGATQTPQFREMLTYWVRELRAPYVFNNMKHLTAQSQIERAMYVSEEWIAALAREQQAPIKLGVFWSSGAGEPYGASMETREGKIQIILTSHLANVDVDWKETFESRFDWRSGDEEEEIQLRSGSPITAVKIEDENYKSFPIHHGNRFIA